MPRIPTYNPRLNLPATGAGVKASVAMAALPGQAITQAGRQIRGFAEALHRAEQVEQLSTLQVQAQKALQELQDSFDQRTDADNFEPEAQAAIKEIKTNLFEKVRDPEVKRSFAPQFERLALMVQTRVRHRAQRLKVEHAQAQVLNNIDQLTEIYGTAAETEKPRILGEISGAIQGGAAAGLWTEPEALKMIKAKVKDLRYADALAEIERDPDSFNPDKYKELDEKTRIELKRRAERLSASRLSQTLTLIRFGQQQADRAQKERRDAAMTDFAVRAFSGELQPAEVYEAASKRVIRAEDVPKAMGWIEKAGQGKDDPWTKLYLTDLAAQGALAPQQVWEAFNEGMLTDASAMSLLDKARKAQVEQPPIMKSPEYRMALDYIKIITNPPQSLTDTPDYASVLREQYAKEEFYNRVVLGGEKIHDVLADIEARYSKRPVPPTALPKPMFGDRTNLAEALHRTTEAYKAGVITHAIYEREVSNIYRLSRAIKNLASRTSQTDSRPDSRRAAPNTQAKSVKEKIKERKSQWK